MSDKAVHIDAPGGPAGGVLVIGYGNTLRSDDGVGWHAAALLAVDPRLAGVEVLAVHQLTPELALDMSRATLVILVDASVDDPAGRISVRPLDAADDDGGGSGGSGPGTRGTASDASPRAGARAPGGGSGASSHHVGPAELLALARALYGAAPMALVVSVGIAEMEVGESLSPAVVTALPAVADVVVDLVRRRRLPPASR